MARPITMGSDCMAMMRSWPGGAFRFGPRFSVELAPDMIVTPLLHGDVRAPGHGYTIPTPRVLVLHARGADQLPSLFGALIAGGHQGKSELIHGYTESVVQVHPDLHPGAVASALAEDIRRCTGSIAIEHAFDEDSEPDPGSTDDRWHVRSGDGFVSVLSPMHRAGRLPWEIQSGLGLSDDFCAHRG